jgi:AraC-like DNA-binding protein
MIDTNAVSPAGSTEPLRVQERGGAVRALYERGLTWVALSPIPERPCAIDFAIRQLPGLGLVSGTVQGVRHERMPGHAGDRNDDLSLHVNFCGRSIVTGRGREIALADGEAVLLSYSEPRVIMRPELVRYGIVRLPRALLEPLVRNIDDAMFRPIPRGTGALDLLANYAEALIRDPALDDPAMRRLFVAQLCDLVAVTLGTREAVARDRGLRAARLHAIKRDVEAHLADDGLSPAAVARRQKISESYLRKLFESDGTSFTEFVLARRLARAHEMLTDARRAGLGIASIAFAAGFGDVSYFNRTFRRSYGVTPSEVREGKLRAR